MAYVIINDKHLQAIADALRKLGGKETYKPREMAPDIERLAGDDYGGLLGLYFKGEDIPGVAVETLIKQCINEDGTLFLPEGMWTGKTIKGDIEIPFGIVEIPDNYFKDVEGITDIEFPLGLTTIGAHAFDNAINGPNDTITLGEDVELVGEYAFANNIFKVFKVSGDGEIVIEPYAFHNSSIEEIELNGNVSIGEKAFAHSSTTSADATALKKLTINGTADIGPYAFENNKALSEVNGALHQVPNGIFSGCAALESVTFGDDIQTIGEKAFYGTGFKSLETPDTVTSIGVSAFENCNLSEVTFSTNLSSIGKNAFTGSIGYDMPAVDLVLPPNVTIGTNAFSYCNLKNITLPDTITVFPGEYFDYTSISGKVTFSPNVTSIGGGGSVYWDGAMLDLPSTVTRIENGAFRKAENVGVHLPSSIEYIGSSAFAETYCGSFKSGFGNNLKSIGDYAFSYNDNIGGINLGNQLTYLGAGAFEYTNLSTITIPPTLTEIKDYTFRNCESLGKVQLPEGLQKIGYYAFANTGIEDIVLPSTLTTIGSSAFYNTNLTSINLPSTLTAIGDNAFSNCDYLTGHITLPSGLLRLDQSVFKNTDITGITLNEGLLIIDGYCLEGTQVTELSCPASLTTFYVEALGRKVDNSSNTLYNSVARIEFNLSPDHQLTLGKRSSYYDGQLVMRKLSGIDANKIIFKGQGCMIPKATNNSIFSHPSVNHAHTLISVPWSQSENPSGFPWGATKAQIEYNNGL